MHPVSDATRPARRTTAGMPRADGTPNRVAPGHTAGDTAMALPRAATARVHGGTPAQVGETMERSRAPNTALAAALDQALLAAQHLREALDAAVHQKAEVVRHLARARALGGLCAPYEAETAAPPPVRPLAALSPREREVLRLLATGHSNRRIAAALYLSPRTVQRHVANLYPKIGAHCRAEATAYALCHGLG